MGGGEEFAKRVWDKSEHEKKVVYLFCNLDGTPFHNEDISGSIQENDFLYEQKRALGKELVLYSLRHL